MSGRPRPSPGPLVVRPADGNDLDGVVAVGRETWPATYASIFPPDLVDLFLAKWWTKDANIPSIRAGRTFVAERDGEIVAMASHGLHEGRFVVWKLYVRPGHQGQGVGGRLLSAMYDRARRDHDTVYLSFSDGNASAYDFARAHGFVEDHREEQGILPELIWMRRHVPDSSEPAGEGGS